MKKTLSLAALLAFSLLLAPGAGARSATPPKTVKLLTIGNSFSGNATRFLADIAKAGGHTLVHTTLSIGGSAMEVHWNQIVANEKDATKGLYGTRATGPTLAGTDWDYVTIQQASIKSHNVDTYRPFAAQLQEYIQKHAPRAELLLHQTWAYRVDDPRFGTKAKEGEPATSEAMYQMLTNAYKTIAKELGVRRIPVGDAFHLVETDPAWAYKPDPKFDKSKAMPPELPDQTHSLHVGYKWGKDGKLQMDGHHANTAGEYLGGCVWYEFLFKESVVGNSYAPASLKPDEVKYLQDVAHRAVEAAK